MAMLIAEQYIQFTKNILTNAEIEFNVPFIALRINRYLFLVNYLYIYYSAQTMVNINEFTYHVLKRCFKIYLTVNSDFQ